MLVDVLRYETPDGGVSYRACEAGEGAVVVAAHRDEGRQRQRVRWLVGGVVALAVGAYGAIVAGQLLLSAVAGLGVLAVWYVANRNRTGHVPDLVAESLRLGDADRRYDLDERPSTIPS